MQFGNLGLHASNTYYVAGNKNLLPGLIGNSLAVSFGLGGVGITIAWIVFRFWPEMAPIHGTILILALVMIPFGLAYQLLQSILIGIMEIRSVNIIELINRVIIVGLLAAVIISNLAEVETVLLVSLISMIFCFCWAMRRLRKYLTQIPLPSMTLFKSNIFYGFKAYVAAFLAFLILRLNLLMVQYMLGAKETGYYSVATSMGDLIYLIPAVIGTILFPKMTTSSDTQVRWQMFKDTTIALLVIIIPLVALSYFLADPMINLLFGKSFAPAALPFRIISVGIIFSGLLNRFLVTHQRAKIGNSIQRSG